MFGDFTFADACFSDVLQVVIFNYKTVHGRTKVLAVIDITTGQVLVINTQKYHSRTKVEKYAAVKTAINAFNSTENIVFESNHAPTPTPTP